MKHGIDKSILKGTIKIFDNTKTNMVEPDRDRLANGWQYQDKAFAEYFNFFWNETSSSLNQINPFILDFADEILQLKSFMVAEGMSASLFDPAQNNWFGKVGEYLSKAIKKEATDRASALLSLQNTVLGKIDEEKNARVQAVNKLTTDLEAEVKNRTDADLALKTSLEGKITEETNARNQLATTLRQEIATASTEDRKWANLTGRPSIFPTNWDNVSGKPSSFPSSWGSITGKPSSFPPASHNHDGRYPRLQPDFVRIGVTTAGFTVQSMAIGESLSYIFYRNVSSVETPVYLPKGGKYLVNYKHIYSGGYAIVTNYMTHNTDYLFFITRIQ